MVPKIGLKSARLDSIKFRTRSIDSSYFRILQECSPFALRRMLMPWGVRRGAILKLKVGYTLLVIAVAIGLNGGKEVFYVVIEPHGQRG